VGWTAAPCCSCEWATISAPPLLLQPAWSYYRDNIEEEFTARRVSGSGDGTGETKKNPLDDLWQKP
jgi:hypothetical protein